jgi:hypothetical protein
MNNNIFGIINTIFIICSILFIWITGINQLAILPIGILLIMIFYWAIFASENLILCILLIISSIPLFMSISIINLNGMNIKLWEVISLLALVDFVLKNNSKYLPNKIDKIFILIIITITIVTIENIFMSVYPMDFLLFYYFRAILGGWAVYFYVRKLVNTKSIDKVLWGMMIIAAITSICTIIVEISRNHYLFELLFPSYSDSIQFKGFDYDKNARVTSLDGLGLIVIAMTISIVFIFRSKKVSEKVISGFFLTIYLVHNIISGSRILNILSIIIIFVIPSILFKKRKGKFIVIIPLLLSIFIIISQLDNYWLSNKNFKITGFLKNRYFYEYGEVYRSDNNRIIQNMIALKVILNKPIFGIGIVGFPAQSDLNWVIDTNGILKILLTYGLIGLFAFLIFYIVLIRSINSDYKNLTKIKGNINIILITRIVLFLFLFMTLSSSPFHYWQAAFSTIIGLYVNFKNGIKGKIEE